MITNSGIFSLNSFILLAVFSVVTFVAHRLGGKILNRESFFTAGGSMPWWAVSASITATAISSVTFVTIPAYIFKIGGDIGYIQIIFGLMLGKILTAALFVKPYYENRSVNTTYDYIRVQIDSLAGNLSMILGIILTTISAGIRVLTTALVLSVITDMPLMLCASGVVGFAVLWSWMGGLKMVIWTDFLLFGIFTFGAIFAMIYMGTQFEMSFTEAYHWLDERSKLTLFDFSIDPQTTYTIWAGLIGASLGNLALAGSQGTMQRIRACKSAADARKAYYVAALLYVTPICMVLVGLALSIFYYENPLSQSFLTELSAEPDRIFPYFIANDIPNGLSIIFIIAILAAGVSTLDTYLTEITDISISNIYMRYIKPKASEVHYLKMSRFILLSWGILYFFITWFISQYTGQGLLDITFKFPSFVTGLILGTMLLARLKIGNRITYVIGLILGIFTVYLLSDLNVGFFWWAPTSALIMLLSVWLLDQYTKLGYKTVGKK
jgi:SSS family transporter